MDDGMESSWNRMFSIISISQNVENDGHAPRCAMIGCSKCQATTIMMMHNNHLVLPTPDAWTRSHTSKSTVWFEPMHSTLFYLRVPITQPLDYNRSAPTWDTHSFAVPSMCRTFRFRWENPYDDQTNRWKGCVQRNFIRLHLLFFPLLLNLIAFFH